MLTKQLRRIFSLAVKGLQCAAGSSSFSVFAAKIVFLHAHLGTLRFTPFVGLAASIGLATPFLNHLCGLGAHRDCGAPKARSGIDRRALRMLRAR